MIEVKDLRKTYRMGDTEVQALRGVSLQIEDGDFVAIMGPSGSGKSTLAHILGLLDIPSSGTYNLNGTEVSDLSEDELARLRREEIGFIFQQFHLIHRLNSEENVALPLMYSKKTNLVKTPSQLLDLVGLEKRKDHRPSEMSGGQQQRVAIARALVNGPRMILADEPTGNLDSQSEREIMTALRELNEQGITIVMVTHEDEIGQQAKRLIRMRDGQIQSDERREPVVKLNSQETAGIGTKKNFQPAANLKAKTKNKINFIEYRETCEHFKHGLRTLGSSRVKTLLSILGILIGVAAVVTMLALGRGAQKSIEGQLNSLGSNLLVLVSGSVRVAGVAQDAGSMTRMTIEDAHEIRNRIPTVKNVSAAVDGRVQATFQSKNWSTEVLGVSSSYQEIRNAIPEMGRFFSEDETKKRARVVVLGQTVVEKLFGQTDPIGQMMKINKVLFEVIGVLPKKGASGFKDQDDVVLIPVSTAMFRLLGKPFVDSIDIEVEDASSILFTQQDVLDLMMSRKRVPYSLREEAFQVRNMTEIQSALEESGRTMSLLLASIAAISLLVGGIGIMNIMLVSVTERTKEVGLRKAIGAERRDILLQFLAEALVVSLVGGISGVIVGLMVTMILGSFFAWTVSVSIGSIVLSFLFSALIGIVFGIYPAKKAADLNPIEALRYE